MGKRRPPKRWEVEAAADGFLREHADRIPQTGPIPIEILIEIGLGIEIRPVKRLMRESGNKAYLTHDGKRICVDEDLMKYARADYRWVMTHEAAHVVRHRHLLPHIPFASIKNCRDFHEIIAGPVLTDIEGEARQWAGRVLVPRERLRPVFEAAVSAHLIQFQRVLGRNFLPALNLAVSQAVADAFDVPCTVAEHRIRADRLWKALHAGPKHELPSLVEGSTMERI